jgi:hypothetical protein
MTYDLIFVETNRVVTVVHRLNVVNGDYLPPVLLKGLRSTQAKELYKLIETDKPTKIIFDRHHTEGALFYEAFFSTGMHSRFNVDPFGTITHKGVHF